MQKKIIQYIKPQKKIVKSICTVKSMKKKKTCEKLSRIFLYCFFFHLSIVATFLVALIEFEKQIRKEIKESIN